LNGFASSTGSSLHQMASVGQWPWLNNAAPSLQLRAFITHADWRIMPNGFAKTPCSRGFVAGRAIVVLLPFGIV
jgi:hypothetical protein